MLAQDPHLILAIKIEQVGNCAQRHTEFPMKQDPLQAQQFLASVVPIPVGTHGSRLQQPDLVVVVQGAYGDTGYRRELLDRKLFHDCVHMLGAILDHHVP